MLVTQKYSTRGCLCFKEKNGLFGVLQRFCGLQNDIYYVKESWTWLETSRSEKNWLKEIVYD